MEDDKKIVKIGGICGIVGIVIFLGIAVFLEHLYWQKIPIKTTEDQLGILGSSPHSQINMGGHFMVCLAMFLFLVAFLALKRLLEWEKPKWSVKIGSLFGIVACPIMVIQMLVQGTIMVRLGRMFLAATEETQRQSVVILSRGLRSFDMGIDLAFDSFFFAAWILLGLAMVKSKYFGKIFGGLGMVLFAITAALNIWAAPNPPSFEMSPIVSLWILAVFVQMLRLTKSIKAEEK